MKKVLLFLLFAASWLMNAQKQTQSVGFIENKGQIVDQKGNPNSEVKYLLNTNGLNVQLRKNGFSYDVYEVKKESSKRRQTDQNRASYIPKNHTSLPTEYLFHRLDIDFINSNLNVELITDEKSSDFENYYNVAHAPNGILGVHSFKKITYKNIYNNIDIVFFIPKDTLKTVEYNFVIHPEGKISDIQMEFKGGKTQLIDNKIKVNVRFGVMEETLPMSWIENEDNNEFISINYKKIRKGIYGFEDNQGISSKKIIIDPVPNRLWGTYYNVGYIDIALANDSLDNLYFCGSTANANNIATVGSFKPTLTGFSDGFLIKFNPNGVRLWGTYYGGNSTDNFFRMKEKNNELILIGSTNSTTNIATPGAFKENLSVASTVYASLDCLIVKFNLDGQRIWGTYFGGEHRDYPLSMDVDSDGSFVVVGETYSINGIGTPGTFKELKQQPVNPNTTGEGFISKFNPQGQQIWGSFSGICEIRGVGIDEFSNVYFSGDTYPVDTNPYIATPGTHQPIFSYNTQTGVGYYDSFLVKYDQNGQRIWGTFYGGYGAEYNNCLKIDHNNNVYISGYTMSTSLIATPGFPQTPFQGSSDAYLAKFAPNGQIIWATYCGGEESEDDSYYMIDIDENNNVFLTGGTSSVNGIATPGALSESPYLLTYDGFIVKFTPQGSKIWGTYFGGNSSDYPHYIKYNKNGVFYVAGNTFSSNWIATPGAHQTTPTLFNQRNLFIEKFKDCFSATVTTSNTPICIGDTLNLTASGGTNYAWTGPNGFISNLQNPTILNANVSHSGQYSCTISGTSGGCDGTNTISVTIGDTDKPVPNTNPLPTITGDCTTSITTTPTATDICAGIITATTSDPLTYSTPGNYTINWVYNDGNGNIENQTQNITITAVPLPTAASPQNFCFLQNATINDITITGQNIQWYDTATGGNLLNNSTAFVNGTTYYASQTIGICESDRIPVTITIYNTPAPTANPNQSFCSTQNATLNDIVISGSSIIWYTDTAQTTILPDSTQLQNATTYYATQTLNGCESTGNVAVTVNLINTLNAVSYSEIICDDLNDNSENIDLNSYTPLLITGTGNAFSFYNSQIGAENQSSSNLISSNYNLTQGIHTIYVRIDSSNSCHQIVTLTLELVQKPVIIIKDIMPICIGSSIVVDAGNGFDSYLWSTNETTQSILINQSGNYSVTVTENHGTTICSSSKNFTVVNSSIATVSEVITTDWEYNSITVLLSSNSVGDYEYSLDGVIFQSSNFFDNLESGEYTVYIRDRNGCGTITEEVYLLTYPKYFTPNDDGIHDYWKIKSSQLEPKLTIKLFDRYGKFIKFLGSDGNGWDGTLNSVKLPADDYWFVVTRENGKEHKGHFTLKR